MTAHALGTESTSIVREQPESSSKQPAPGNRRPDVLLEATELTRIRSNYSRASSARLPTVLAVSQGPPTGVARIRYAIKSFWKNQISVTVDHVACRDHLALERTFLGYLRTSLALSMIGVTVAQLFRLQHAPKPSKIFGFYILGKPLACICQAAAIYALLLGAYRTWRIQNAMVRGKAIAGGFEIVLLGSGVFVMCFLFFVLAVAIDISKEGKLQAKLQAT